MARFTLPRDIYFGRGSLETLKTLDGKRASIVIGGSSMKKSGVLDKVQSYLKEAGIETQLIEGVEPDPSVETVLRGGALMREFNPDWIIALGGGSPMDAAKAMWVFYEYPDTKFEDLITPFSFPKLRTKARFMGIASTSGTASEVTAFSVITDYSTGVKYPLADFNITPDVAIVDADIADTMPDSLTAYTGMDALTHAIEAYVSDFHNDYTDPLALKAIQMVVEFLPASYKHDRNARERMHNAQCLAGMAFSNALLGITHSMAHKTGAAFEPVGKQNHIAHGEANAMYLPYVIRYNAKACAARYADIARSIGLTGKTDGELVEKLCNKIEELNKTFGIPSSLKEYGIPESEFKAKIKNIAKLACEDACTPENPRKIDAKEMEKLFTYVYEGKKVDF